MYGLALTEVLILLFAVIPAILYRVDLKEVFPFKVPRLRHALGSMLLWFGTYLLVILVTQVTLYFFPEGDASCDLGFVIRTLERSKDFSVIVTFFILEIRKSR